MWTKNMSGIPIKRYIIIFIILSGCVPVPIPVSESPPFEDKLEFLKVGSTTRKEVLFELGDPFFALREDRFFGYVALRFKGAVVFLSAGLSTDMEWDEAYLLGIEFDEHNVVTYYELALSETFQASHHAPGEYWEACLSTKTCIGCRGFREDCRVWEAGGVRIKDEPEVRPPEHLDGDENAVYLSAPSKMGCTQYSACPYTTTLAARHCAVFLGSSQAALWPFDPSIFPETRHHYACRAKMPDQ
jgi:hypothetical protein